MHPPRARADQKVAQEIDSPNLQQCSLQRCGNQTEFDDHRAAASASGCGADGAVADLDVSVAIRDAIGEVDLAIPVRCRREGEGAVVVVFEAAVA